MRIIKGLKTSVIPHHIADRSIFFKRENVKKKNAYKRKKTETQKRLEGMRSCKSIWVDMSV